MSLSKSKSEPQAQSRQLAPTGGYAGSSLVTPDALLISSEYEAAPILSAEAAGRNNQKSASMACEACKVSKRKVG